MPVQSPQTTLSLTTGCVLSVAAGTRPQLWINKEWQQRGLPAFMASASSEWMEMGDSILGGGERSAPSCATCLPHCLPSAYSHSTHTARLHKTTFVKKSFLQVFVREVAIKWPRIIKLKRKQNKREIQLLTSNVNNWLQKSSWKDGSSDKVSYSLGWKQSFLRFKITGLLFLHVRTYELKVESFTKAYPSLSPLPQWWPMALLHILLKEHRSNWKTILRPMHGAPLPMYWISTLRFCCFSGNVYVTCHFSKQKSCFFSLGNITSRYAYLLLIWFCFDIDIALINGLYGASITMLLLRRRIDWTQTSANKGNDF